MHCKTLLISILLSFAGSQVHTQTWTVPDEQKAVTAPFKFTPDMQKTGEQSYLKYCQSCHGIPGKDNWVKLVPPPGDLSKEQAQKQTDGEIFYKITAGKAPMPEFRNIIPEEERWHIVAYLRTFNPGYIQPEPASAKSFAGRTIFLGMDWDSASRKIVVSASELLKDNGKGPAAGVEVMLFVHRYFGKMQIGEIRTTGETGKTAFDFPPDLPGDANGNIILTAIVNDPKSVMRSTPAGDTLPIGLPTLKPGLTETRAWWSTRDKSPLWISLTYTLAVIIVWGFIFYILFNLMKIKKLGSS